MLEAVQKYMEKCEWNHKKGGENVLKISYDKLFAYLYKNSISKSELAKKAGVSRNSIIKMANGEVVHMSVIMAICEAYHLELKDVVELVYREY